MDINLSHNEIQFYYGTTHNIHIDLLYVSIFTRDGNFFLWDEILRDPIPFETGLKHIFVPQKNIETGVKYFFISHLHIRNETGMSKSRLIPSHC